MKRQTKRSVDQTGPNNLQNDQVLSYIVSGAKRFNPFHERCFNAANFHFHHTNQLQGHKCQIRVLCSLI